ncbi:MAG: MazG family protein [Sciscionella sp.]
MLPPEALPVLRAARVVYAAAELDDHIVRAVAAQRSPDVAALLLRASEQPIVLLTGQADEPAGAALRAEGVPLVTATEPRGARLVEAAEAMDRLRSPGGCPWDAEQTHESLRQYLIEETYELLEAIEDGDREALREELGDVLLQVLFHARVASEDPASGFDIDDVAAGLVDKLVGRHPHVFGPGDSSVRDATSQELRWEELKQVEKRRQSTVDGVAFGQPAVALAAKLVQRATRARFPADLLPSDAVFAEIAGRKLAGADPEGELRAVCRGFADDLRTAELAARDAGMDPTTMDEHAWRKFLPRRT